MHRGCLEEKEEGRMRPALKEKHSNVLEGVAAIRTGDRDSVLDRFRVRRRSDCSEWSCGILPRPFDRRSRRSFSRHRYRSSPLSTFRRSLSRDRESSCRFHPLLCSDCSTVVPCRRDRARWICLPNACTTAHLAMWTSVVEFVRRSPWSCVSDSPDRALHCASSWCNPRYLSKRNAVRRVRSNETVRLDARIPLFHS